MPSKIPNSRALTYKGSGVDVSARSLMIEQIQHLCARTHSTRVLHGVGSVKGISGTTQSGAGLFRLDFAEKLFARNYKDPVLIASTNGVGTKIKVAAQVGKFDTIGIDLVAMTVNDLIVQGGEPLFFLDYLGVHKLDPELLARIIKGISDGCMEAGCALLSGETAEMSALYSAGDFDMAGFAVGVVERAKLLDPRDLEAGDSVIGVASSGLHANGYTLVRQILKKTGVSLTEFLPELKGTLAEELLRPARIYVRTVEALLAKYKVKRIIKAMAHIAANGLGESGNLPRMLPEGFSVRLRREAWEVPAIFQWLQKNGPVDLDEMFNVFNMGIGYVMVVRPAFTKAIITHLRTLGEKAVFLGKVRRAAGGGARVEWG